MILATILAFSAAALAISAYSEAIEARADRELRAAIIATASERRKLGRTRKLQAWT
jgi:hypothetical protein